MPITSFSASAAVLSLLVNGTPMQATYLQSDRDGCEMARETAVNWKKQTGVHAVESRVADWCTVGAVISGQWVSEQWRTQRLNGKTNGWRIVMPLGAKASTSLDSKRKGLASDQWQLDVIDPQISTRIRYRQSLQGLDLHHRESHRTGEKPSASPPSREGAEHPLRLSRHRNGDVLLSGKHPDGGSYSVLIERSHEK